MSKYRQDVGWALLTFIALDNFKIFSVLVLVFIFKALCFLLRIELNTWAVPTLQDHRSNLWKILIILDYPGQTITDFAKSVTSGQNDKVIAVKIPNIDTAGQNSPNYPSWWNPLYRITVSQLETDIFNSTGTKYDFLSGLPYAVESSLKENLYSGPTK